MLKETFTDRNRHAEALICKLQHFTTEMWHLFVWQTKPHAYGVEWLPFAALSLVSATTTFTRHGYPRYCRSMHHVSWVACLAGQAHLHRQLWQHARTKLYSVAVIKLLYSLFCRIE